VTRSPGSIAYAAAVLAVLLVGLAVLWPTLELGLMADDYMAVAVTRGELSSPRHPLDAFAFVLGRAGDLAGVQRLGTIAWWAPPDFRLAFLRPLSGALWHLDQALFGDDLRFYHAHSLAAWAALALLSASFYRSLFSRGIAALACAVFALDQSQHMPAMWLSNRGGLYAVLFGVLGVRAHLSWRERGQARHAWGSIVALCLGLACGEWVLPMFAYLGAYELVGRDEPLLRRAAALLPAAAIAVAFLLARSALGYGAHGSGIYVDPAADPLRFAMTLTHRVPVFVADMLTNLPSQWWDHGSPWRDKLLGLELIPPDIWTRLPPWHAAHAALGVCAVLLAAALLRACLRGLPARERRDASWLLAGSLLSLLPVAGSFPSTRLTLAAMFGAAPAFALVLRHLARQLVAHASAQRNGAFAVSWVLAVGLGWAQLAAPLRNAITGDIEYMIGARRWVLSAELDPSRVATQRVLLLSSTDFVTTHFWAYTWRYHGRPMPRSYYPLSTSPTAHDVERPAPNELILRPLGALFFESAGEQMFRAPELSWRDGEQVVLPGMVARIEGVRSGMPLAVRLTFEVPVDDPSLAFLISTPDGLTRVELPAVGETVRLPAPAQPSFLGLLASREKARFGPWPEELAYVPAPWFVDYVP
jgi:hypothetical protein